MLGPMLQPRSDNDYGQYDEEPEDSSSGCREVLLFPVYLILSPFLLGLFMLWMLLAVAWMLLSSAGDKIKTSLENGQDLEPLFVGIGISLIVVLALISLYQCRSAPAPTPVPPDPTREEIPSPTSTPVRILITPVAPPPGSIILDVLVDDFAPQPHSGTDTYFYNRLGGDRGALNNCRLEWLPGQVITTVPIPKTWGGGWMSLNHPIREETSIDFAAVLPPQIQPEYQSQVVGLTVNVKEGTSGCTLKLELKDPDKIRWVGKYHLHGGPQVVHTDLPRLREISEFLWMLDGVTMGGTIVLDRVVFETATQITDTASQAFVWSYGMLLNNWNPDTGLVRDKSHDASGEFDAIQATGSLAAATAMAEQLGVVSHADAVQIVNTISDTLLLDLPLYHGLWPHWVQISSSGSLDIVPNTEWSSVDTVIAAIGLLTAQHGLGLDASGTEQMLREIDWADLELPGGLSHGYGYGGERLPYAWDVMGGESWLVELVHAGATGRVSSLSFSSPPTANGSGFIDELAWLFVPAPTKTETWGTDWVSYRQQAADAQIAYYPDHYPESCFSQHGLFGLSAGEVPDPSFAPKGIYQAFGVGGRFAEANDGSETAGGLTATPHYAAMVASLRPDEALEIWKWLIDNNLLTPLTNVESLMFPPGAACVVSEVQWTSLKGSWNLALQALGWGRYLAQRAGYEPVLWQATSNTPLLQQGYALLVPEREAHPIPGRIEAEDYDPDGPEVGYHDTTAGNTGGEYRDDDVDIEVTTDAGGGCNVGWTQEGEWLAYTVVVTSTGRYDIQVRVASAVEQTVSETLPAAGNVSWTAPLTRALHVEVDGKDMTGPMSFVATGGWQNWTSVFARRVPLTEGQHTVRLGIDSDEINVNWIAFTPSRPSDEAMEQTIDWLLAQMTLEEKIDQLYGIDWMDTADNTRLGIPGFRTADGPHGLRGGPSTSFPVGIAMAATWDRELLERVGIAMGCEFQARGRNQALGPCLDLTRDPRNGRSSESGGEDPYLAGQAGTTLVRGIQSTRTIATIKHFLATNHQQDRRSANHTIDARTLREFYGLPFRMGVQQGGVWSVMNAYNWVNGLPSSANRELLTTILREEWGFPGYVISDWGSIYGSATEALKTGCDLDMPHASEKYPQGLPEALASRELLIETLDQAVRRVLRAKIAAGLLSDVPIGDPAHICSPEHRQLAREVAQESIVLLKNEDHILPLDGTELTSIALIGPSADVAQLDGRGSSVVEPCYTVTPHQGIAHRAPDVTLTYAKGCDIHSDDKSGFPAAIEAARNADVVIFVGGLDDTQEGEELDRVGGSVELPGQQQALIRELAAVNPNLVVVLESGGIVSLEQSIDQIKGLLHAFYPGQEGGNALADILFGEVNPSGKLPVTMPRGNDQLPAWEDLDFSGDVVDGFGYRRFDRLGLAPRYAFGYGLSYTTFEMGNLIVSSTVSADQVSVVVSVDVTNTGTLAGDEVVQLYLNTTFADHQAQKAIPMPVKQLRGFQRVSLAPGQRVTVTMTLGLDELAFWSVSDSSFRVEAGTYTVYVGASSDSLSLSQSFPLTSSLLYESVTGKAIPATLPVLANVALDQPSTCSSVEGPDYACGNAVDGDLSTRWSSQFADSQWIQLDLGQPQQIERMALYWETAYGQAYQGPGLGRWPTLDRGL